MINHAKLRACASAAQRFKFERDADGADVAPAGRGCRALSKSLGKYLLFGGLRAIDAPSVGAGAAG